MAGVPQKRKRSPNKAATPKARPASWSPQWLLAWRREHPDTPMSAQYSLWASQWGTTRDSIQAEIRIWKRTIPNFREDLLAIDPGSSRPAKADGHHLDDFSPGWMERFCSFYRTGSGVTAHHRKKSADAANLSWETIRKKLDPKSAEFDQAFADMVEQIEAETTEDARAGVKTALEMALDQDDARTLGKLSLDVLERRAPGWERNQKLKVEGTIFHAPAAVRERALAGAVSVSRQVVAVSNPALPEHVEPAAVEIIEAEYVVGR